MDGSFGFGILYRIQPQSYRRKKYTENHFKQVI